MKNFDFICIFLDIERRSFTIMAKFFGLLAILFQQDCQNCLLLVLENKLGESFFVGKKYNLLMFSDTVWKNLGHLSNLFGGVSPNWLLCKQRLILSINGIWGIFFYFRKLGENFSDFGRKNFWPNFQKDLSLVQRNTLKIIAFFEKWNNLTFFADSRKNFVFPERFYRHYRHKCIINFHWNALKKMQLWKLFCLFLPFSDKGRTFLDLSYVSIGTLWGKLFFFWTKINYNFFLFGHWTNLSCKKL